MLVEFIANSYSSQLALLRFSNQRLLYLSGIITCFLVAGIGCAPYNSHSETLINVGCPDCSHYISDYDESTLSLSGGEVICITETGHFAGRINRPSGSGLVRICNEGRLSPRLISFHSGITHIDNFGIFQPGAINLTSSTQQTHIINHPSGRFTPGAFNLHGPESQFHNYGEFSPDRLLLSHGARIVNHASGQINSRIFSLKKGSKAENHGSWILVGDIARDATSTFRNEGEMQLVTRSYD